MKIARFFAVLLGIFATALMALSIGLCLVSLDAKPMLAEAPDGAVRCVEDLQAAVNAGDFQAISQTFYGQPELGAEGIPDQSAGIMVWDAFKASLSLELRGECYASNSGICYDAVITALDIPSVTGAISTHAHALLSQRVASAQDMSELYDENYDFRQDLVAEVMNEAVIRALAENSQLVTREVTLKLVCQDGAWRIAADAALLELLSGSLA